MVAYSATLLAALSAAPILLTISAQTHKGRTQHKELVHSVCRLEVASVPQFDPDLARKKMLGAVRADAS